MAATPQSAAKTGRFYSVTDDLKDVMYGVFSDLESDDDLDALVDGLDRVIRRAGEIREAALQAATIIREL